MNIEADQRTMVEVSHLTKAYGNSAPAIEDISLSFKKGEFIVLLGPSGVGKSTLLRCLNFLVRPTSGIVRINGQELGALSKKGLLQARHHIGMIFQEFNLVNRMSVLMNVMCGRLGTMGTWRALTYSFSPEDHEAAVRALVRAGLEDQELYLRRADTLSGGQKQRVSISRALAAASSIVIFDDALSSVDTETEDAILTAIPELLAGKTFIIVAHRFSTLKTADVIVVLDEGRIVQQGNHEELLAQPGFYSEVYHLQQLEESIRNKQ